MGSKLRRLVALCLMVGLAGTGGAAYSQVRAVLRSTVVPLAPRAPRNLGLGITESKFVPMTPCRLADTRTAAAGILEPGQVRTFRVRGAKNADFAGQGGIACNIPAAATGIEGTITTFTPAGKGYVRTFAADDPEPVASFMYFNPGLNLSNTGALAICNETCLAGQELKVRPYNFPVHIALFANGYYVRPMAAVVSSNGAVTQSSRLVSSGIENGLYRLTFDRSVVACAYNVSVGGKFAGNDGTAIARPGPDDNSVFVRTFRPDGAPEFRSFQLVVTC